MAAEEGATSGDRRRPRENKYLVFSAGGGTGFIGTALTQLLKARGHEVTLVSRKPGPGRITWVCPSSGNCGRRSGLAAQGEPPPPPASTVFSLTG